MGLFPRVPTDRYRGNFVNPLNSYEIHEMFSEEKLKRLREQEDQLKFLLGLM